MLSRIRDQSRFGLLQTALVSVRNFLTNTICLNSQECCLLFRMEKCSIFGHDNFSGKKKYIKQSMARVHVCRSS